MSNNDRYLADRVAVVSASGAIVSGAFCAQEGWFGVAATSMAPGAGGWLKTAGTFVLPVPVGTVKGGLLYATGANPPADATAITLTGTAAGGVLVGKAVGDRDSDGKALVRLIGQS
jgi:predicted RecA/RadA family phage recombinase